MTYRQYEKSQAFDAHVVREAHRLLKLLKLLSRDQKCTGRDQNVVTAFLARVKPNFGNAIVPEPMGIMARP